MKGIAIAGQRSPYRALRIYWIDTRTLAWWCDDCGHQERGNYGVTDAKILFREHRRRTH